MPFVALADLAVALVAILVILAGLALAWLAGQLVPNLPVIGGAVRNAIVSMCNSMVSAARGWADGAAVVMAFILQGTGLVLWWAAYYLDQFINDIIAANDNTRALGAQAVGEAEHYAQGLYNEANANAAAAVAALGATIPGLIRGAESYSQQLYNEAVAGIGAGVTAAEHYAQGLYNQAIAYTNGVVGPIQTDINSVTALVEGNLSTALSALTTQIDQAEAAVVSEVNAAVAQADAAVRALQSAVAADLGTALDVAAADVINPALAFLAPAAAAIAPAITEAEAAVLGLDGVISGEGVTTFPAALGALTAVATATATEVADCLAPNCEALGSLGSIFHDLSGAALWALLLALVTEAAHDPQAAADDMRGALGGPLGAVAAGIMNLVGVAG